MFRTFWEAKQAADTGAATGAPPATKPGSDGTTADATGTAAPPQGGTTPNGGQTITLTEAELQQRIEASLKERLERAQRKAETEAAKVKADAEAKSLVDQQKWQELAEKRAGEIAALQTKATEQESIAQERDRYKAALEAQLKTAREGLPPHIVTLLDKLDPVEQLNYIAQNAGALKAAPAPNVNATDQGGKGTLSQEEIIARKRRSGYYS